MAALAACGGGRTDVAEHGAGNQSTYSVQQGEDGATTVQSGAGTATIRSGNAAAALPPGFTLYPGAQLISSTAVTSADTEGAAVVAFRSDDPPERIVSFYKAAAARAGYRVDGEFASTGMAMIAGRREGAGAGFTLTVNRIGGTSEATLIGGR